MSLTGKNHLVFQFPAKLFSSPLAGKRTFGMWNSLLNTPEVFKPLFER